MTIPRSLVQAVSQGRIVPFVGSGASMAVKRGLFPSWDGLLLNLAEKLDEEANEDTAEIVRRFVKKKQLNKAADEAVESLGKAHFRDVMKTTFGIQQPKDVDLSLPKAIWSLEPRVVVTTNYDRVLEWAKPSQAIKNSEVANLADLFSESNPENPAVWFQRARFPALKWMLRTNSGKRFRILCGVVCRSWCDYANLEPTCLVNLVARP